MRVLTAAIGPSCLFLAGIAAAAGAEGHLATVANHPIYYEIHGQGTPVVLLHGGGGNIRNSFYYQLQPLAEHHQVIAIEQRGQGHSPDVPGPLTYANMTEDTAALLKLLGVSNADVVGFSDGAIIALMLGIRYPELVRRIVASGANLDPHGMTDQSFLETRNSTAMSVFSAPESREYASISPDGIGHIAIIGEKLRQLWLNHPTAEELTAALLSKVHGPVLVMAGDNDEIKLEHTVLIYHSLPNARLWILPATGHATFGLRPQWVNPMLLSFLEN